MLLPSSWLKLSLWNTSLRTLPLQGIFQPSHFRTHLSLPKYKLFPKVCPQLPNTDANSASGVRRWKLRGYAGRNALVCSPCSSTSPYALDAASWTEQALDWPKEEHLFIPLRVIFFFSGIFSQNSPPEKVIFTPRKTIFEYKFVQCLRLRLLPCYSLRELTKPNASQAARPEACPPPRRHEPQLPPLSHGGVTYRNTDLWNKSSPIKLFLQEPRILSALILHVKSQLYLSIPRHA